MAQKTKKSKRSLVEIIASKVRRASTTVDALIGTLEEVIKISSAKGGLLFLIDNTGINTDLIKKGQPLKVSTELIVSATKGLPQNYALPVPIFIDDSIKDNKEMIHKIINGHLSEILTPSSYNSTSFFMSSNENPMQGIIYVFHDNEISITKEQQKIIENELSEVCIILGIISEWHLHKKLVEFNALGLTVLEGNFLPNFVEQMLSKASELIGCSGLSMFTKEPSIKQKEFKFALAGTYPRKKPEEEITYYTNENCLTSKSLNIKHSCTVHYSKVNRNQIQELSKSNWRDIEGDSLSVMYIPIKKGEDIVGLLRCTNISSQERPPFFNFIDIHFAEVFSSLMFTWLTTSMKEARYSDALVNISHEIKQIAGTGIKGAAQYIIDEIDNPKGPEIEKIYKLIHIMTSADLLIDSLPALRKSQGKVNSGDSNIETAFLPYAELCKPICETYRSKAKQRKISIVITGTDQIGMVYANLEDFKHIFQNLINNAVKYTYEGDDITVKMQRAGTSEQYAMIHVMSKSLPIDTNEREFIFWNNYRSEHAKKTGIEGEGRGLMIARTIARRLGGDIAYNNADGYNIFTILIPANILRAKK